MIALGPQLGIGKVACDRPAIGAVALAAELHFLHQAMKQPGAVRVDAIFDLHHDRSAAPCQRELHSGSANRSAASSRPAIGGILIHSPSNGDTAIMTPDTTSAPSTPMTSAR